MPNTLSGGAVAYVWAGLKHMGTGLFIGLLVVSGGCSWKSDYGRAEQSSLYTSSIQKASFVRGRTLQALERASLLQPGADRNNYSRFNLLGAEEDLRSFAIYFSKSPKAISSLSRNASEDQGYADALTANRHANAQSRLAEIGQQIGQDDGQLRRFQSVVGQVLAGDAQRLRILNAGHPSFDAQDRRNTLHRVKQNRIVMRRVLRDVDNRLRAYGYAIERTRVEAPQGNYREVYLASDMLRERFELARAKVTAFGRQVEAFSRSRTASVRRQGKVEPSSGWIKNTAPSTMDEQPMSILPAPPR